MLIVALFAAFLFGIVVGSGLEILVRGSHITGRDFSFSTLFGRRHGGGAA